MQGWWLGRHCLTDYCYSPALVTGSSSPNSMFGLIDQHWKHHDHEECGYIRRRVKPIRLFMKETSLLLDRTSKANQVYRTSCLVRCVHVQFEDVTLICWILQRQFEHSLSSRGCIYCLSLHLHRCSTCVLESLNNIMLMQPGRIRTSLCSCSQLLICFLRRCYDLPSLHFIIRMHDLQ